MDVVTGWTGQTACALQSALRLSNIDFARHLGVGTRTVSDWHDDPGLKPRPESQQLLDSALALAAPDVRERFAVLTGQAPPAVPAGSGDGSAAADAERRLIADENVSGALAWLDRLAGWHPGTARQRVAERMTGLDRRELTRPRQPAQGHRPARRRGSAGRVLPRPGRRPRPVRRAVRSRRQRGSDQRPDPPRMARPQLPLTAAHDRLRLDSRANAGDAPLDSDAASAAVQRLAETLVAGTRFADMPLYRLTGIDTSDGQISGSLGITQFASYALTLDVLEGELRDALAAGVPPVPGSLPLRDRYLPDTSAVLGIADRLCAGGPLALCAFARPADPYRGPADYVLLVQERSASVVNAARQLAVIPKGFHQPLTDFRGDAKIGATLRREMEEELFGREDIDNTIGEQNAADPMHPARLSEPMRWLLKDNPSALRMECTGFGLNLVSGNFEFASLVVVDSDDFWERFGGQVQAGWESSSLRQYSSLDGESLAQLAHDSAWSNEGLFAFLQGLRRLSGIGGDRVDIPAIDWTMRP